MLYAALHAVGGRAAAGPLLAGAPHVTAASRVAAALHADQAPGLASATIDASNTYAAMLDPALSAGLAPVSLAQGTPLRSSFGSIPSAPPEAVADAASAAPAAVVEALSKPSAAVARAASAMPAAVAEALAAPSAAFAKVASASPAVVAEAESAPPAAVAEAEAAPPDVAAEPMSAPPAAVPAPENALATPPAPETAESVPLPTPRPPELRTPAGRGPIRPPVPQTAQQNRTTVPQTADNRGFFEKLFGAPQRSGPALAYASPDDGALNNSRRVLGNAQSSAPGPSLSYDRYTAVYDISAHTVYLPNGERLEAHSGLGSRLDDPRFVSERNRGATPPHIYDLGPRAELFHGVQALRLNPIGGDANVFGRTGLLAHTYMLGPNGDSNGCVSFKNYRQFLQAFMNGEVKRLAVVARLN